MPSIPAAHHGGAVGGPVHRRRTRDALSTFLEVLEQEAEDRRQRRINRLRKESRLPAGKTWETFEHERMPLSLQQQLGELAGGNFVPDQLLQPFGPYHRLLPAAQVEHLILLMLFRRLSPPRDRPPEELRLGSEWRV